MTRAFNIPKHIGQGIGLLATIGIALAPAHGGTVSKADNADALNLGSSWIGNNVPGATDIAQWSSVVTGTNNVQLGVDASWQGLSVLNPAGAVTIGGANTLTLGRSGIDMSNATADLAISTGLALLGSSQQIWQVAAGRTLNLNTGVFTRNTGSALNIQGDGTVSTTNISNNATGIIGPWATIGTGASTRYATVSGGSITSYTGTAAATAANVTSTSGTVNYDVAAAGALGTGASYHTLRYTGTTGSITGVSTANGIMNVGGGTLTLGNTITVGSTNELVLNTANGNIAITFNVANRSGNSSRLIKTGSGTLTMSIPGSNPVSSAIYSGGTYLLEGNIDVTTSRSLGDAATATVFMATGTTLNLNAGNVAFTMANISGSGTINVLLGTGAGTVSLSRSNLSGFTGILNIGNGTNGGKFTLTSTTGGTSASAINVAQNATLHVNGTTVSASLTLSGGDTGESLGQLRIDNGGIYAGNITLAGNIVGAGDGFFNGGTVSGSIGETGGPRTLSKITSATLTLSGANTYSGATSILGGTLTLSANLGNGGAASDVLGTSSNAASNLLLGSGTTLSWAGEVAASTDRLFAINGTSSGNGATISANGTTAAATLTFTNTGAIAYGVANQNRSLTLRGTNTGANTLASTIQDNGTGLTSLTKLDEGTWVITGNNTYKDITQIFGGTLSVATINSVVGGTASSNLGAPTGTGFGTIRIGTSTTGATLRYTGDGETTDRIINLNGTTGGATLEHAGTGLLKFTSSFTATGAGTKTLTLSGSSTGVGEIEGTIVDNSVTNQTNVNKTGVGTWVLSGFNAYTGTTTVTQGVLQVGRLGSGRTGAGAVTIQSGGTISGTGLVNGATFTAQSGAIIHAGDGTAQADYGILFFESPSDTGHFNFQAGSKVILGINPGGEGDMLSFYSFSDGTLIFEGDLTVTAEAYSPVTVESFSLLDFASLSTTSFNSRYSAASYGGYLLGNGDDNLGFDLPDIAGSGFGWDISQFTIDGTISTVAIPEPSRMALLLIGLVGLAGRRRK